MPDRGARGSGVDEGAEPPPGIRDRVLGLMMPAVLVLVAVGQLYLATSSGLSPWRGGGFGMFSTADRPEHRAVRVSFAVDGTAFPVDVRAVLDDPAGGTGAALLELRTLPATPQVSAWVDLLHRREWELREGVAEPSDVMRPRDGAARLGLSRGDEVLPVEAVVIEVWRPTYDRARHVASPSLVARHVVPGPDMAQ